MAITREKINTLLKLHGYDVPDMSDDEFNSLVEYETEYLLNVLDVSLEPVNHDEVSLYCDMSDSVYLFGYYPIVTVKSFKIVYNDSVKELLPKDYDLDNDGGILHLKHGVVPNGYVKTEYVSQVSSNFKSLFESLLSDVVLFNMIPLKNKDMSSIKEGDISISYDNSSVNTLSTSITDRINHLKGLRKAQVRMM